MSPNLSYDRSTRRERDLVKSYKAKGWESARSAGSHGKFDVWAWNPIDNEVNFIQVKTKRGGRTVTQTKMTATRALVQTWEEHYE